MCWFWNNLSCEIWCWSRWGFKLVDVGGYRNSGFKELGEGLRVKKAGLGIIDWKGVVDDLETLDANWVTGDRSSVLKAFIGSIKGRGGLAGKSGWNSDLTDGTGLWGNTDSYLAKIALGDFVPSSGGLVTSANKFSDFLLFGDFGKSLISLSTSFLEINGLITPSRIRRFHSLSLTFTKT